MFSVVTNIKKAIDKIVDVTVLLLLTLLLIVTAAQVISRYFFGRPIVWSEELARYIFVWVVFLSASVVFRLNKHMTVDFFVMKLTKKGQKIISAIVSVIIAAFLMTVLYYAPVIIQLTFMQTSATLSLPLGYVYMAFPLSAALMLLELIFRLLFSFNKGGKMA